MERVRGMLPEEIIHAIDGALKEFVSLTGECGIILKAYLMECFCGENNSEDFHLPTFWCSMPCTWAANYGVSSKRCNKCYRYGLCPNLHDLVQEMGRVNREQNAERGTHSYSMYVCVTTFSSLWIRTQREHNPEVRAQQEAALFEVLHFTMLPKKCYHEFIAEHFENRMSYRSRGPYRYLWSYCIGAYKTSLVMC